MILIIVLKSKTINHDKQKVRIDEIRSPDMYNFVIWSDAISSRWFNFVVAIAMCISNEDMTFFIMKKDWCQWMYFWRIFLRMNWNWSWWRHQMEAFSALLALCEGNSPVTGEFPSQRPVTRSFDVIFDLNGWVNNREAGDLRRHRPHYGVTVMCCLCFCISSSA